MLHITNGDSAGNGIQQTAIPGEVLAWNDVLHEGPTPAGLSLEQMSQVRARFISGFYSLPFEEVTRDFTRRDTTLAKFRDHEEVVLWFEHDLYDQLQLIQLLDWFAQQVLGEIRLSLICIDTFPGFDRFYGLGQLTAAQLASLFDTRQEITQIQLQLGSKAWNTYCSSNPLAIETLRAANTSALPFLGDVLFRFLEEYPATVNGLSRTEQLILEIAISGIQKPFEMFRAAWEKEVNPFMGDTTFWVHLAQLCQRSRPLLKRADDKSFTLSGSVEEREAFLAQVIVPTKDGHTVLENRADWIMLNGGIDRWLGGVHLQGQNANWRWDRQSHTLVHRVG